MKVKAVFIGEEGSMGFMNGKSYEFMLSQISMGGFQIKYESVTVPYSSLNALLSNWKDLSKVN